MMFVSGIIAFLLLMQQSNLTNDQMDGAALARRMMAEAPKAKAELSECYRSNVLRLGAGNTETADTLLRGVRSICEPLEARLTNLYVPEIQGKIVVARQVTLDRRQAEDKAVTALLEQRAAGSK